MQHISLESINSFRHTPWIDLVDIRTIHAQQRQKNGQIRDYWFHRWSQFQPGLPLNCITHEGNQVIGKVCIRSSIARDIIDRQRFNIQSTKPTEHMDIQHKSIQTD